MSFWNYLMQGDTLIINDTHFSSRSVLSSVINFDSIINAIFIYQSKPSLPNNLKNLKKREM